MADDTSFDPGSDLDAAFAAALADDEPAPSPDTPDAAPAETPPAVGDRGDGRDEQGRFASKEASPTSTPPIPDAAKAPDPTAPPTPSAPAEQAAPPAPETPVQPFLVRYGKQDYEVLPGAVVTPHGIVVPTEQAQALHTALGQMLKYREREGEIREQLLRTRQAEASAKANEQAIGAEIGKLFEIAAIPDEEQRAVAAVQYIMDLAQMRPVLEEKMQLARERAELDLRRQMAQPDPEAQREQITQQVVYTAGDHLRSFAPYFQGLTDEDQQAILQRVLESPERFAYRVGQQPTQEEQEIGARPGEIIFDVDALHKEINLVHGYRQRVLAERQRAEDAVKAAQANARTTAAAAPPPPPPPTSAPDAPAKAVKKKAQSYDEWKEALQFTLD